MGAHLQSGMRRLWFLAVLLCLWPFAAQAITRTPFSLAPEPPQKPPLSSRLERAMPRQESPPLLVVVRVWPDGRIGLFCGGDPIDHFDSDGRCIESGASAVGNFYYNGGPAGYVLNGIGNALNSYNSAVGAYTAYLGTLYNEAGAMVSPSTYVNGLSSFGNNISTVYNDSGLVPAISYGATSWNVGAVWSGAANINLATGQPVGNGVDQAEDILSGIAGTAGVAAGGVSLFNWATAPAATAPATATADATPASTPIGQSGSPLNVSTADGVPSNTPSTVSGIDYSGHALDQMQSDGIMPSAVQNTINQGQSVVGKVAGTTVYYEPVNNITVVTDASSGRVVTVSYGQIRQ